MKKRNIKLKLDILNVISNVLVLFISYTNTTLIALIQCFYIHLNYLAFRMASECQVIFGDKEVAI